MKRNLFTLSTVALAVMVVTPLVAPRYVVSLPMGYTMSSSIKQVSTVSRVAALAAMLVALLVAPVAQAGKVTVAPKRLVFEGRERAAQVALINHGTETTAYRVLIVEKRMTSDGRLVDEEVEPSTSAASFIRYSPRRVVLEPGGKQTVRLMVRRPKDLPVGEYRSHLLFRAEPNEPIGTTLETIEEAPADGFTSRLIPLQLRRVLETRRLGIRKLVGLENYPRVANRSALLG